MYHSPGLRDGGVTPGYACATRPPEIIGVEQKVPGVTLAGNKFGPLQVFPVGWDCVSTLLPPNPEGWRMPVCRDAAISRG